ncbi:hypothetical protein OQA88_518 [Cercophora sp. LCS_1]
MASFLDLNLSYYTVPVAFVLIMAPNMYAAGLAGKNYDLANPRKTEEHVAKDEKLGKTVARRISRAKAAAANGFETIGLYAAAVVAANAAKVDVGLLNKLTLAYVVSRAVYDYVYVVLQDNRHMAPVRSLVWMVGLGIIFTLFISSGNALN